MDLRQNNKHKRIKRRRVIISFLFLIFLVISCKKPIQSSNEFPFQKIEEKVTRIINGNDIIKEIDMTSLTPFNWDKLYIFKPYELTESVDNELEFDWDIPKNISILHDEINNLLVFTKNDSVVTYIQWPKDKGDFMRIETLMYSNDSAKFILKKEKYGGRDKIFIYEDK